MKKAMLLLSACLFSVSTMVAANATDKKQEQKPVGQWTCQDFLMLDDSFKPTAVAFAEGVTKQDKIVDPTLDIQGIARVIPVLVQECNKNPKDKFVDKLQTNLTDKK